jgi:hypothetical protein
MLSEREIGLVALSSEQSFLMFKSRKILCSNKLFIVDYIRTRFYGYVSTLLSIFRFYVYSYFSLALEVTSC